MENLKITVHVTVTSDTDRNDLKRRVFEQMRKLSNPVRTDEGITTVNHVYIGKEQ